MEPIYVDGTLGNKRQLLKNKSTATKAHISKKPAQGISSRVLTTTSKAQQPPAQEVGTQAEHQQGEKLRS